MTFYFIHLICKDKAGPKKQIHGESTEATKVMSYHLLKKSRDHKSHKHTQLLALHVIHHLVLLQFLLV